MSTTPLRLVIALIGLIVLTCVVGIVLLSYAGKIVPDVLQIVATSGVTGMIGVLVPSRSNDKPAP